jgi:metal-responsive CopG/Arc/MetJ family transcriptional regulator
MAEVISISLDEESVDRIDRVQEMGMFAGRSELVRTAVQHLEQSLTGVADVEGEVNAVIVVTHPHRGDRTLTDLSHRFEAVIDTQLHNALEEGKCLEMFHVRGDAKPIRQFYYAIQGSKHTDSAEIVLYT